MFDYNSDETLLLGDSTVPSGGKRGGKRRNPRPSPKYSPASLGHEAIVWTYTPSLYRSMNAGIHDIRRFFLLMG
jgi:hypothetical protein